jgi:iron-sulfur cluster repair protein YtfE (RIC family)
MERTSGKRWVMVAAGGMPSDEVRRHHLALRPKIGELARVAGTIGRWSEASCAPRLAALREFLVAELVPYLSAELHVLYPALEAAAGAPEVVAVPRAVAADIRRRVEALAGLVLRVGEGPPTRAEAEALRAGLYGLWALVATHLTAEEAALFPLLDARLSPAGGAALAGGLAAVAGRPPA